MILAQSLTRSPEHFKAVQQRFVHDNREVSHQLLYFVLLLVAVGTLLWLYARIQQARSRPAKGQPMKLYLRLQRQLQLPLWARFRLWQLARQLRISNPAALLISEQLFDEVVERYRHTIKPSTGAQASLAAVRALLFPANGGWAPSSATAPAR